jgi:hypothetical protein
VLLNKFIRMIKDPVIGVLAGIGTSFFVLAVVWFSGLIGSATESQIIDKLKSGDSYFSRVTTRVTESAIFKSVQETSSAIKEANLKILQAFSSHENPIPALEIDKWQRQALALGIRSPNIQSVSLIPKRQFSSTTQVQGKRTVKIQCTVVSIERERLVVEIEAWIDGEKAPAENSYTFETLTPGKVFDLLKHSRIAGVSSIKLAILSRPENDRLIIAMDGFGTPNKVS